MVLHLAEQLDVPLRERNGCCWRRVRARSTRRGSTTRPWPPSGAALDLILAAHEPYPALVVDRHWNLVAANAARAPPDGRRPGAARAAGERVAAGLHPDGLAPRIDNLAQWRAHVLRASARDVELTADPGLARAARRARGPARRPRPGAARGIVVRLRVRTTTGR